MHGRGVVGLKSYLFSIVAVSCFSMTAFALETDIQHFIVVSATRSEQVAVTTPASIQIIDEQQIRRSMAQSLAELLRNRGGLVVHDLFGDGSKTTIGMRGFSESASQNTLIMVDGRRLNNADIGGPELNGISMMNVERVEIIRGSAGVLFGDQAVAGVINIITRKPDKDWARLGTGVGSYQRKKSFFNIDKKLDEHYSIRINGEALDTENYRDHNQYDRGALSGLLNYDYAKGSAFVELSLVNASLETPGALSLAQVAADRKQSANLTDFTNTRTLVQRAGIDHDINDIWDFLAELTNKEENNPYVVWGSAGYQARQLKSFNPRLSGSYPMNADEMLVTIGVDYEETDFLIESPFTNRSNNQETASLYWQAVIPMNSRFSLTAGMRHARQENFIVDALTYATGEDFSDEQTVGELGLSFEPDHNSRLFFRVEQNYRFPKIDEQAYTSPGNILNTQTGVSWEMGYENRFDSSWFSINAYQLELEDEIAFDPTATKPVGAFFNGANVNFEPTTHKGIIAETGFSLMNNLSMSVNYSYTDARFDSGVNAGKRISFVPEHSARLAMDWMPAEKMHALLEMLYTSDRFVSGDNANVLPEMDAVTLLNLTFNYHLNNYNFGLRVNNLTNQEYNDFETPFGVNSAPQRNYWFEVSAEF
jgi:iron complex outermembrane receptor protein